MSESSQSIAEAESAVANQAEAKTVEATPGTAPKPASSDAAPEAEADPRTMPGLTDYELIKLFRKGQQEAFEALVYRHKQITFNFIYRMVGNQQAADDLFQDMWLKVLRNAHTYRPRAKFTTWALQIARNTVLDYFKRENLRAHVSLDLPVGNDELSIKSIVPSKGPQPEEVLLDDEMMKEVQNALCRLPIKQQESLVLRIYHKMPYSEISELLGSPEGTVKYWVHEAVKALTAYLEKRGVV